MKEKEKIIAYIDKLLEKYPKNYYLLTVAEFVDSLQEETVSEDLEEAAKKYGTKKHPMTTIGANESAYDFKAGAVWQKENLWKPADGRELPEIDRNVICLLDCGKVVKAHRPSKKNNLYVPETYGKGEWSYPNIKYWLDCEIPKLEED